MRAAKYGRNNLRNNRRFVEGLGGSYTVRIFNGTDAGVRGGRPDTVLETTLTGTKIEVLQKCCCLQGHYDFYDVEAVADNLVELVADWCGNDEDEQNEWFDDHATVDNCIDDLSDVDVSGGGVVIMSVKDSKGRTIYESDLDFWEENDEFDHPEDYSDNYDYDDDADLDEGYSRNRYAARRVRESRVNRRVNNTRRPTYRGSSRRYR